jgi:site-specific DNA-cytosine methylase
VQDGGWVSPALTCEPTICVFEGMETIRNETERNADRKDAPTQVVQYRIRKPTPRETGRLMGLSDGDIDKMIAAGISKSALYRLHGNSIVVDVLYYIFRQMFFPERANGENVQLKLF